MGRRGNEPRVEGREGLGRWLCEAHNEVGGDRRDGADSRPVDVISRPGQAVQAH